MREWWCLAERMMWLGMACLVGIAALLLPRPVRGAELPAPATQPGLAILHKAQQLEADLARDPNQPSVWISWLEALCQLQVPQRHAQALQQARERFERHHPELLDLLNELGPCPGLPPTRSLALRLGSRVGWSDNINLGAGNQEFEFAVGGIPLIGELRDEWLARHGSFAEVWVDAQGASWAGLARLRQAPHAADEQAGLDAWLIRPLSTTATGARWLLETSVNRSVGPVEPWAWRVGVLYQRPLGEQTRLLGRLERQMTGLEGERGSLHMGLLLQHAGRLSAQWSYVTQFTLQQQHGSGVGSSRAARQLGLRLGLRHPLGAVWQAQLTADWQDRRYRDSDLPGLLPARQDRSAGLQAGFARALAPGQQLVLSLRQQHQQSNLPWHDARALSAWVEWTHDLR